jgi:hypothetical protein
MTSWKRTNPSVWKWYLTVDSSDGDRHSDVCGNIGPCIEVLGESSSSELAWYSFIETERKRKEEGGGGEGGEPL